MLWHLKNCDAPKQTKTLRRHRRGGGVPHDHRFQSHNEIFTVEITDGNVDEATLTLRIDDALILLKRFEFGKCTRSV